MRDSTYTVATFRSNVILAQYPALEIDMPLSLLTIDVPEKGVHTYTVTIQVLNGTTKITGARLIAYEL
jgi:hypothetical protein